MPWLEITVSTQPHTIGAVAEALTAGGFPDLVLEDQSEFETFLNENRAYWDYIDEDLQQKLQGLSCIKLYLEDTDEAGMARLQGLLEQLKARGGMGSLALSVTPLPENSPPTVP